MTSPTSSFPQRCPRCNGGLMSNAETGDRWCPRCLPALARSKDEEIARLKAEVERIRGHASRLIDILTLPGHAMTREEWDEACLLTGRFGVPMPDWDRDAGAEVERMRPVVEAAAVERKAEIAFSAWMEKCLGLTPSEPTYIKRNKAEQQRRAAIDAYLMAKDAMEKNK